MYQAMNGLTDSEIERLMADPRCPWFDSLTPDVSFTMRLPVGRDVPAAPKPRSIHVDWFLRFAHSRGYLLPSLEAAVDAYVHRLGGTRERVRDPSRPIRNAVRRLRGRPAVKPEYVWVLPPSAPHADQSPHAS
jgi:hypothetical protein